MVKKTNGFRSMEEVEKTFLPNYYKEKKEKTDDPYELGVNLAKDTMRKIRKT